MSQPSRPTLLSAAKAFAQKSARVAALAVVPLAAVSTSPKAEAQAVFGAPSISFSSGGSVFTASSTDLFGHPLSPFNNIQGLRLGADATLAAKPGGPSGSPSGQVSGSILNSAIPAGTTIPVSFDFTIGKSGTSITLNSWEVRLRIGVNDWQTFAASSGVDNVGTFSGAFDYAIVSQVSVADSYAIKFSFNYSNATSGDQLLLTTDSGSGGFSLNSPAVPEPATYAILLGAVALGAGVIRRSRRPLAA